MGSDATAGRDELWARAAARILAARGWSLAPLARLGRPRDVRRTWLAEGEPGTVVVKAVASRFASERAGWVGEALALLRARGCPAPALLWQGPLDEDWWLSVQERRPGRPLRTMDPATLDRLLALVELQADPALPPGGWDVSWWTGVVLFEGWEHWWGETHAVAPATAARLREFLEPAWGHRLPTADLVHGDLGPANVLADGGVISGVVDWDDVGLGSRATDLAGLLFGWHRLRLAGGPALAPDGGERLVRRIVAVAGEAGLRCTVAYGAVARLGLAAQRGEREDLATWRQVTDAILASLSGALYDR
ncbi:MAG TPA: aminoglycoside phosphotransferase family protein [Actinomycetes bacterium]